MSRAGLLILAGGGHSHALLLKRWAMHPKRRPNRCILLINRHSTALYSGMVPGLIAGLYKRDEISIDLRQLCDRAGVAFIEAEITGLKPAEKYLELRDRPALNYDLLSLNVGAVSKTNADGIAIKPLEPCLTFLESESDCDPQPLRVIGAGAAGLEVVMALRRRWPQRTLQIQQRCGQLDPAIQQMLRESQIEIVDDDSHPRTLSLLCTGSQGPSWLAMSNLPLDPDNRICTDRYLNVEGHPSLFASGDCAVINATPRPASGVWAVRAEPYLAKNLEAACKGQPLRAWYPQRQALQLIGSDRDTAWARWGRWKVGPSPVLFKLKQRIDRRFMAGFQRPKPMNGSAQMACRGCAAKLPAQPLAEALDRAGLGGQPEDAVTISANPWQLQSVDGFPALVSDPWLNGRLTTLHACSDIWACGAAVTSAMATITLPMVASEVQRELLAQTLAGIRSALIEQGADLIGGHTMESRSSTSVPESYDTQISITVNGRTPKKPWMKSKIKPGDSIVVSREIGSGVLFAGHMTGHTKTEDLDKALRIMRKSQHEKILKLEHFRDDVSACTDITGFGLLGHLSEMILNHSDAIIILEEESIPIYEGAKDLWMKGVRSSLAPHNQEKWELIGKNIKIRGEHERYILEALIDPQTCGPLLIACKEKIVEKLTMSGEWIKIGVAL